MKALRTLWFFSLVFALGASFAAAQSLADVAKKEKKRRETNKTEAKRVITDRELTYGYGGPPSTESSVTVPGGGEASDGTGETGEGQSAEGGDGQEPAQTEEYWRSRVSAAKEKIAGLEKQLQEGDWGEGLRQGVDPRGQQNLAQRAEVEQQLTAARAELQGIQMEARRAGVSPGWVR